MNLQENIQRIRKMMGLLTEDNHYYDKILDLYSEVDGRVIKRRRRIFEIRWTNRTTQKIQIIPIIFK
jgi:hypothetical protein